MRERERERERERREREREERERERERERVREREWREWCLSIYLPILDDVSPVDTPSPFLEAPLTEWRGGASLTPFGEGSYIL